MTPAKAVVGLCLLGLVGCGEGGGSPYPSKPIEILVGQGAGGSTDTVARTFAQFLSKHLASPVVVRNMEGAGGRLMLKHLSAQPKDGYSLCLVTTPSYINVQLLRETDWNLETFTYIFGVGGGDANGLIVPYDSPLTSFADIAAKAERGPVTAGTTAPGSNSWLLGVLLKRHIGQLDFKYVPFDSGMKATMAVAGGHVDAGLVSTVNIPDLARDGKIRALAVSSPERLSYLPDVPTFAELGHPGIVTMARTFLAGPPELPDNIKETLARAASQAVADPEFLALAKTQGFTVEGLPPHEAERTFHAEFASTRALLKETGEIQ